MLPTSPVITLSHPDAPTVVVRSIDAQDLELLRVWKNANRFSFFFKDVISPEMQARWYEGYATRPDDFMLMVEQRGERVGCIGFRRIDSGIDVYNIIRGVASPTPDGAMTTALDLVCAEGSRRYPGQPIVLSVLRSNPALQWYFRRGFTVIAEHDEFLELTRDKAHWTRTQE